MIDEKTIDGFPEYTIDNAGNVYSKHNGAKRKSSVNQYGHVRIPLSKGGFQHTRSLSLLVAQHFVPNPFDPEVFDGVIHLDNDLTNNSASNLMWRPIWFVRKYHWQYHTAPYRYQPYAVIDEETEEYYENSFDACQKHGLLWFHIFVSCTEGGKVFPTTKTFKKAM